MKILDWIQNKVPGTITRFPDRVEIKHVNGDYSTLWLRQGETVPENLKSLGDLYEQYDGMDLFSSTFKIAALRESKGKNGVELVFTLAEIGRELSDAGAKLPEEATTFMYRAGIGIYSVSKSGKLIYEWDTEYGELGQEYTDVFAIFDEWLQAVTEK